MLRTHTHIKNMHACQKPNVFIIGKTKQKVTARFESAVFILCADYVRERKKRTEEKRKMLCVREKGECAAERKREKSVFACVPVPSPVSELSECDLWL